MAKVQFSITLGVYCGLISSLEQSGGFTDIIADIRENAHITNEEKIEPYIVHLKIDSSYIGTIVSHILRRNDFVTSEADGLLKELDDKIEARRISDEKQSKYDKWLRDCFNKYVVDDTTPSYKELAVMINNNELEPGAERIKYQSIVKPLKMYREEKFGIK